MSERLTSTKEIAGEGRPALARAGSSSCALARRFSYYHLAQQWVCAELVRRVDGRPFPTYLREEITGPLEMNDTHMGLPAELEAGVAPTHLTEAASPENFDAVRFNHPGVHRLPAPVFGVSTAPDMARFYATLTAGGEMDGVRVLGTETVAYALAVVVDGEWDQALGGPVRRCLGFNLSGLHEPVARTPGTDSNSRTFYHEGAGTVLAWGDLDLQLTMAFLTNGFRPARYALANDASGRSTVTLAPDDTGARRERMLSDAVRTAATGR